MHGKIEAPVGKLFLDFQCEQAFSANFSQGSILYPVTTGGNGHDFYVFIAKSVGLYQKVTRLMGLCERQCTPTCTNLERFCLHWRLSVLREFELSVLLTTFSQVDNAAKDIRFTDAGTRY